MNKILIKKIINNLKNNLLEIFEKKGKFLFFLLLFLVFVCSGLAWYFFVYNYSWDEGKKQDYIKSKSNEEIFFNKSKFDDVVLEIERRKTEYQKTFDVPRDIFGIE
jgi:anionic cell wall polymer biosynthesis LytR-Cps2A-Psr (LCP) family protein